MNIEYRATQSDDNFIEQRLSLAVLATIVEIIIDWQYAMDALFCSAKAVCNDNLILNYLEI